MRQDTPDIAPHNYMNYRSTVDMLRSEVKTCVQQSEDEALFDTDFTLEIADYMAPVNSYHCLVMVAEAPDIIDAADDLWEQQYSDWGSFTDTLSQLIVVHLDQIARAYLLELLEDGE